MPRVSKAKQKEKGLAFLADLIGKDVDELTQEVQQHNPAGPEISMLQAEGVLLHIYNANRTMLSKYCKECKEVFSTRYQAVAYCSNSCRRKAMERVGIHWNPQTDNYANIGAERPIVVSPEVHAVIVKAAQRILEDQNIQLVQDQEPKEDQGNPAQALLQYLQGDSDEVLDGQYPDVLPTSPEPSLPELDDPLDLDLDLPSPF